MRDQLDDMDPAECSLCTGTGIGQHGDPDTSRCSACGGSGVARHVRERDPDEARERAMDERMWRDW